MSNTTVNSKPFVSILMLTYNRGRFIQEAIASVLAQTYKDFELVIIDDGSTDETASVIASFSDPRIQYVRHPENKGLLARRQESLSYIRGTYVAVLDSDDAWLPEKLETQVAYLEAHKACVLVGTWITRVDDTNNTLGETHYETTDVLIRQRILWRNQFAHSSVLIRNNALTKTSGYRFPLDEDLDLFLQLGVHGTFANIPEALTSYRVHEGGKSANRRGMVENVLAIIKVHKHNYPGYLRAYLKYKFALLLAIVRS